MIKLVGLKLRNFLSFKELDYEFEDKAILIQGENNSDSDQESNGSGKSAIQAGIEFCLFKNTSRKVKDIELINFDEDVSMVQLSMYCNVRQEQLTIQREIRRKSGTSLSIEINSIPQSFATVNDGDKLLIDWIGINKEDLQNYYIINKERFRSIFSSSNREKIDIINRFSRASLIDGIDKLVNEDVLRVERHLTELIKEQTSLESRLNVFNEQLFEEENFDFDGAKQLKIESIQRKIELIKIDINLKKEEIERNFNLIKNNEQESKELQENVDKLYTQLSEINGFDFTKETSELASEKNGLFTEKQRLEFQEQKYRVSIREVNETITDIEKNVKGSVTCPKCGHEFNISDPNISIEEEKLALTSALNIKEKIQATLQSCITEINRYEDEVRKVNNELKVYQQKEQEQAREISNLNSKIRNLLSEVQQSSAKLNNFKNSIQLIENDILNKTQQIEFNLNEIEEVKQQKRDDSRIVDLKSKIKDVQHKIKGVELDVSDTTQEIYNISQWIINFKKFRLHLANRSLMAIQANCNKFMQDIKSDIQIRWEGQKIMANGSLKDEIASYVIRDNEVRDFWSFSGGERARMEYAMIFTLQKMINSTNKWGGLYFTSLDEISEGLDALGLQELMKSLDGLNRAVLITTHVINRSISDNVLLVRKENKVSRIIKN